MGVADILSSIDRDIAILQQARALLSGDSAAAAKKPGIASGPGRKTRKKRNLTPEGRKRIAEAARRRWERHREAAAK